jgi:hypothetical protein
VLLAEHLDGLIFLVGLLKLNWDLSAQAMQRVRDMCLEVLGVLSRDHLNQYGRKRVDQ